MTVVTSSTTSWSTGWYEVQGSPSMQTVTVSGDVNLILPHATSLRVTRGGIQIQGGGSLTIWGTESNYNNDGTLTANGYELSAGIGAVRSNSNVRITFNGGVVSGFGTNDGGAGIGGGAGSSNVTVTINAGAVSADSGNEGGSGIGGGDNGSGTTVNINGGTVNARSFDYGAAIGAGGYGGDTTVNINGGTVNARSTLAAAIGAGYGSYGATVNINGGTVATSEGGIGGGNRSSGVTVNINGGAISARDNSGAGIGAGQSSGVEVFINGGSVKGGVSVQPKNKDGENVYLLQVENPQAKPVTVNGLEWSDRNSAAVDGDTNLYMYVAEGSGTVDVAVGDEPVHRWKLNEATKSFEVTAGILYYNLVTGTTEQHEMTAVTADVTAWDGNSATGGWYVADDAVSVGQVTVSGNVNLVLMNGKTLTVEGIRIQNGGHLTVWVQSADYGSWGVLNATGGIVTAANGYGAITFNGGKIIAGSGSGGVAIGAVGYGADAQIEINAGLVTASGSPAIGAGSNADATVKIAAGSVKATGGISPQPVDGRGRAVYLLKVENPRGQAVIANGTAWDVKNHAAADGDTNLYMYRSESTLLVTVGAGQATQYTLNKQTGAYEVSTGILYYDPLTGQEKGLDAVELVTERTTEWFGDNDTGGWYAVVSNVTLSGVSVYGDVNLVLASGAGLTSTGSIRVHNGGSLTIWGQNENYMRDGRLTATGDDNYSAIGAGGHDTSTVTFNGGVITATGGKYAAAIGSSYVESNATVVINAGLIEANGGHEGAGVGAGYYSSYTTVIINGGTVTARGGTGSGAGVGAGYGSHSGASVTINGGAVTAYGGWGAAGIGSAYFNSYVSTPVTITGGTVTAVNGGNCADIGAGYYSSSDVTITGGSVKGGASQPHDANGDPAYQLTVENPNGAAITVGGREWNPRNHAALGETDLYLYLSKANASSDNLLRVAVNGDEKVYAIGENGIGELGAFAEGQETWEWAEDHSSATLSLPLQNGGEALKINANIAVTDPVPATCTAEGTRLYTASVTLNGKTYTSEESETTAALGHIWSGEAQWLKETDEAIVTFTCGNDASHQESVTVTAFSAVTKRPTCAEPGARTFQADASEKARELGCESTGVFTYTEAIPALGHDWDVEGDDIGLIPGSDGDYTTLTITCRRDHSHTKTVYTEAEKLSETPATCTSEGSATYRMSYEFDGVKHVVENEDTYTLPKLPHTWGPLTPVAGTNGTVLEAECTVCHEKQRTNHGHTYVFPDEAEWTVVNDRVVSAAVKVACTDCSWTETLTYSGDKIVSRPVAGVTCTTAGWTAWTVNVDMGNEQTASYTRTTQAPAKGHTWAADTAATVWSEDHSAATFTFKCATCGETVPVRVKSTVLGSTDATCEQSGETVYSASTEYSGVTASATETVQIPALGHDWDAEGDQYPLRPGVDGDFTTVTVFCKRDEAHTKTVYATLKKVGGTPATCTEGGTASYKMEYTIDGKSYDTGVQEDFELPALGHRYTDEHVCAVCDEPEPQVVEGVTYEWILPPDETVSQVEPQTAAAPMTAAAGDTEIVDGVKWATDLPVGATPFATVTAIREGRDGSHITRQIVVTDLKIKRTEKCGETGTTKYTAVVEIGGKRGQYTLELADVAPAEHQWSDGPTVVWSDDMRTATLALHCVRDASHSTEPVTAAVTAKTVTAATCETAGQVVYTATAMIGGAAMTAEKTVETAALGHAWCFSAEDANPPKLERVDGVLTATFTCRNDASHTWTTTDLEETLVDHVQAATGGAVKNGRDLYRICVKADGKTYVLGEEMRAVSAAPIVTVANAADGIKLTWTSVAGADTYRVYYRVHGGKWQAVGHTPKLAYTWKHGTDGTKYEFTVRGCTVSGTKKTPMAGGYNTSRTIQYVLAPKVTVKAAANGIQVSWTKTAGADTYRVYYKTAGGKWQAIGHNANMTYVWRWGKAGTAYQFTVRPCTVSGTKKTLLGSGYNTSKSVTFPTKK